jgi:exosortase
MTLPRVDLDATSALSRPGAPAWRLTPGTWIRMAVLLALGIVIYRQTLVTLWDVWMNNPSYSHGVLVPLVSGFLIWLRRRELRETVAHPSWLGIPVIGLALVVQLAGLRGDVLILQGNSLVLLLAGLVLHFGGWGWARIMAFPVGYLVFMVPFLPIFESQVSFRLKQLAASGAVSVSSFLGVLIQRDGMSLYLPTGSMRIENACSGMQSLISLLSLGALFAYMAHGGPIRRGLLFLSAIPIAVLVNVIRITGLCVVGTAVSVEAATGLFHDVSGFVLFGLGFVLLVGMRRVLRC